MGRWRGKNQDSPGGSNGVVVIYTSLFLLLLTFFILLNSLGRVEESRLQTTLRSLRAGFHLQPGRDAGADLMAPVNPVEQDYVQLRGLAGQEDLGQDIVMLRSAGRRTLALSQGLLFAENGEDLTLKAKAYLTKVAEVVKDRSYPVSISGHLDPPESRETARPDELALSGRRALAVLRFLVEKGVEPQRLAAFGLGSSHPLLPLSDPRHHRMNDRVDLVLDARDQGGGLPESPQAQPQSQFRGFVFDLLPDGEQTPPAPAPRPTEAPRE